MLLMNKNESVQIIEVALPMNIGKISGMKTIASGVRDVEKIVEIVGERYERNSKKKNEVHDVRDFSGINYPAYVFLQFQKAIEFT